MKTVGVEKKSRFGQFKCMLLTSRHDVCKEDQEKLFSSVSGELDTSCKRCNVPVHVKANPEKKGEYLVSTREE